MSDKTGQTVEIRWHGRGGQGAKTACLLLAEAAFFSGKYVQGFPEYGPERMGASITAYNRISDVRCSVHCNIDDPDYVVVVDETLLTSVDVTAGLSPDGAIVINTGREPEELRPLLKGEKVTPVRHEIPAAPGEANEPDPQLVKHREKLNILPQRVHALKGEEQGQPALPHRRPCLLNCAAERKQAGGLPHLSVEAADL